MSKPIFRYATCPKCGHKFPIPLAFPLGKKDRKIYDSLMENPIIKDCISRAIPFFQSGYKRELLDRDLLPLAQAIKTMGSQRFDDVLSKWIEERKFLTNKIPQFIKDMEAKHGIKL